MTRKLTKLAFLAPLALAACFDTEAEMKVDDDGSVDFKSEVIMNKKVYEALNEANGDGAVEALCEAQGGEFDPDMFHVNCKVEFQTSLDAIMTGSLPTNEEGDGNPPVWLGGLTLADNGDGTYAMSYAFDWTLLDELMKMGDMEGEMKDAEDAMTDEEKDAMTDEEKDAMDDAEDMGEDVNHELDGYKIDIEFKAPNVISGNGDINGSNSKMEMEIDLGDVNKGEATVPESFDVVFSLNDN